MKSTSSDLEKSREEIFKLHLTLNQIEVLKKERDQYKERAEAYYQEI